jgi:ABC-type bacteriocin/lantibiotic exporter with double-glycine peptidase domain
MVLAHYGGSQSEGELRQLLGTTARGTPVAHVNRLVPLGYEVQFGPSNLSQPQAALAANSPPIVFVLTGSLDYWTTNSAHAAVLVGVDGASAYLNDPFFGTFPQRTSLSGFQQAWALTRHLAAVLRPRP